MTTGEFADIVQKIREAQKQYFKTHSFKAYVSNSTTNKMTVGFAKHLVGNFSGSTISWTTNTTTSIYLEKIWLVE